MSDFVTVVIGVILVMIVLGWIGGQLMSSTNSKLDKIIKLLEKDEGVI